MVEEEKKHERHTSMYPAAVFQLIIAIGIGTIISKFLSMTGMTFPIYIGAMIAAACMRNIGEYSGKFTIYMGEINDIGGISLSLFLGIAMITLKLWQLADLALPLITLLAGQTILMFFFTYFVIFNIMGRDYDAAVLSSGVCGFGMGATPNAMANMQAICERYVPSVKAYLLVPLIGSLFADFLNSLVITFLSIFYNLKRESMKMFGKRKRNVMRSKNLREKLDYKMKSENVAIPEIHTKDFDEIEEQIDEQEVEKEEEHSILYDNVAIPEVHLHKKKK